MKLTIVGYGKMGHMVHALAREREDVDIVDIVDPLSGDSAVTARALDSAVLKRAAVFIDFSTPDSVMDNIALYASHGATAVVGTTGWKGRIDEVRGLVEKGKARVLHSGNFSLGVTVFLKLVEEAGRILDKLPGYDMAISEIHHSAKADSPSGTALMAADKILSTVGRKKGLVIGNSDGRISPECLQVSSMRVGSVPGVHTLLVDGGSDTVTIQHSARDRMGFASGALEGAFWLIGQEAGLYSMDDFASSLLGGKANA